MYRPPRRHLSAPRIVVVVVIGGRSQNTRPLLTTKIGVAVAVAVAVAGDVDVAVAAAVAVAVGGVAVVVAVVVEVVVVVAVVTVAVVMVAAVAVVCVVAVVVVVVACVAVTSNDPSIQSYIQPSSKPQYMGYHLATGAYMHAWGNPNQERPRFTCDGLGKRVLRGNL